jgi:hypothetical protein
MCIYSTRYRLNDRYQSDARSDIPPSEKYRELSTAKPPLSLSAFTFSPLAHRTTDLLQEICGSSNQDSQ